MVKTLPFFEAYFEMRDQHRIQISRGILLSPEDKFQSIQGLLPTHYNRKPVSIYIYKRNHS